MAQARTSSLEFQELLGFQQKLKPRRQCFDIFEMAALLLIVSKLLHDPGDGSLKRSDRILPRLLASHSSLLILLQLGPNSSSAARSVADMIRVGEITISEEQRQLRGHSRPV